MPLKRALNVIEFWCVREADAKEQKRIEKMMNGPRLAERLATQETPQTMVSGPIAPPDWWDEDDDNALKQYQQVAKQLSANK